MQLQPYFKLKVDETQKTLLKQQKSTLYIELVLFKLHLNYYNLVLCNEYRNICLIYVSITLSPHILTLQEMKWQLRNIVSNDNKPNNLTALTDFLFGPFYSSDNCINKPDSANLLLSNSLIKTIYCYHCDFSRTSKPHSKSKQQRSSVYRCAKHALLLWQPHN